MKRYKDITRFLNCSIQKFYIKRKRAIFPFLRKLLIIYLNKRILLTKQRDNESKYRANRAKYFEEISIVEKKHWERYFYRVSYIKRVKYILSSSKLNQW